MSAAIFCSLSTSLSAHAAGLNTTISDAAGRPLTDAVVMVEPTSGALPVKPLSGVQISQVRRQFDPTITVITVGTSVTFPNFDTVRHHVYSFSPTKTFELKLYAGTPAAPVVFDKPGIAVLGCNIHDDMAAWVVVVDTPFYARSAATGKARIDAIPAGNYRLRAWHSSLAVGTEPVTVPITIGNADVEQRITLSASGPAK